MLLDFYPISERPHQRWPSIAEARLLAGVETAVTVRMKWERSASRRWTR